MAHAANATAIRKNNQFKILNGANNAAVIAAAAKKIGAPPSPQDELDDLAAYLGTYVAGPAVAAPVDPVVVVEYFHADFNHYFVTILPAEMTALDSGTQTGWKRTGKHFYAWKSATDAPASGLASLPVLHSAGATGTRISIRHRLREYATVDAQFPIVRL